ncbi:MAG: UPF0280 family protein [Acidimicrobiales bacterium]
MGPTRQRFVDGPIDLVIDIDADPATATSAFDSAYLKFEGILPELVSELEVLRSPTSNPRALDGEIAITMRSAAERCSGDAFSTPMIAVAGAVADFIKQEISNVTGVRKATVNNGGDISIVLSETRTAVIGVVESLGTRQPASRIEIAWESPIRGVATSGAGGRSLSLGIADSVTTFARTAAVADAAATFIANRVDIDHHPGIERRAADMIDEGAGLGNRPVPVRIPELSQDEATQALQNGVLEARRLYGQGVIEAAFLTLQGQREFVGQAVTGLG